MNSIKQPSRATIKIDSCGVEWTGEVDPDTLVAFLMAKGNASGVSFTPKLKRLYGFLGCDVQVASHWPAIRAETSPDKKEMCLVPSAEYETEHGKQRRPWDKSDWRHKTDELYDFTDLGVSGFVRVDGVAPIARGQYAFFVWKSCPTGKAYYAFHPDDLPLSVNVHCMLTRRSDGMCKPINQQHPLVKVMRSKRYVPKENAITVTCVGDMGLLRRAMDDMVPKVRETIEREVRKQAGLLQAGVYAHKDLRPGAYVPPVTWNHEYGTSLPNCRCMMTPIRAGKTAALEGGINVAYSRKDEKELWHARYDLLASRPYKEAREGMSGAAFEAMTAPYKPLHVYPAMRRRKVPFRSAKESYMSMTTHCTIVGAPYHKGAVENLQRMDQVLFSGRCGPDTVFGLQLKREPENKHDPNAVAVWTRFRRDGRTVDLMLGYIPRQDAKTIARVMDNGVRISATYKGKNVAELWWPASTKDGVDEAYRKAMAEGEGL